MTADNYAAVIALDVAPEQRDLVAANVRSLADAYAYPAAQPYAVVHAGEPVGFVLLFPLTEDETVIGWNLVRLMVDQRFQRRGVGGAALEATVELVRATSEPGRFVQLSVLPHNAGALALYAAHGFRPTGEVVDGERVLRRDL